ncbi:MAG: aminotransferase class V-fold PLP-dependent enzyme [Bacteroidetes bacterium]|nr:MAG: aminotransferase class V-fold PLP-dependent enzyme [Bacteroidota bacterium]
MDCSFITQKLQDFRALSPAELASREDFWGEIQALYDVSTDFVNVENGYYGVLPRPLLEAYKGHIDHLNRISTYYARFDAPKDMERLKTRLAPLVGSLPTEIAFSRNATESLNVIISGIDLQAGEEILIASHDYPTGIAAASQRHKRYGTPYRVISEKFYDKSKAEILAIFEEAIQPQTRLLVLTHLIHYTGQILPVREITAIAHAKGVEVMVDSSHAFAQFPFQVSEIGCDYWVGNLHKWLYAPLTGGIIAIRQDKIHRVWGLLGDDMYALDDIRKLERFSALPMPTFLTMFDSVDFLEALGLENKQARLQYLQHYWSKQLRQIPRVQVLTPEAESGAIATFTIEGLPAPKIAQMLWEKARIHCAPFQVGELDAVRITIQLYTRLADLDTLVKTVQEIASK